MVWRRLYCYEMIKIVSVTDHLLTVFRVIVYSFIRIVEESLGFLMSPRVLLCSKTEWKISRDGLS
jgi:hypothetical protein